MTDTSTPGGPPSFFRLVGGFGLAIPGGRIRKDRASRHRHDRRVLGTAQLTKLDLVAEYPGPQTVNFSIMVGLDIPQKVEGCLLRY